MIPPPYGYVHRDPCWLEQNRRPWPWCPTSTKRNTGEQSIVSIAATLNESGISQGKDPEGKTMDAVTLDEDVMKLDELTDTILVGIKEQKVIQVQE